MWQEVPELTERSMHAMAYDPVRRRIVLFGGDVPQNQWEMISKMCRAHSC